MFIDYAMATRTGRLVAENQDATCILPRARVFAITDGTGTRPEGLTAGQLAAQALKESFRELRERPEPGASAARAAELELRRAIRHANARLWKRNAHRPAPERMTSSLVVAQFSADEAAIASVGDARAYRRRDGELERLTADHTLLEQNRPYLNDAEVEALKPLQDVLSRALGYADDVAADVRTHQLLPDDRFLLCSNGLTDALPDSAIAEIMMSTPSVEDLCETLARAADAAHGRDNITVIAVRLGRACSARA